MRLYATCLNSRRTRMHANRSVVAICSWVIGLCAPVFGQSAKDTLSQSLSPPTGDPVKALVGRLDLERYKATIKGLTQFGDRQHGTDRNRAAVDWIEAQLRDYGCNTERVRYVYDQLPQQPQPSAAITLSRMIASGEIRAGAGGSRLRGMTRPATPNNNPDAQSDPVLRSLNSQPSSAGPRAEVYCTKVGVTHPDEMYIVGAHMDGRGFAAVVGSTAWARLVAPPSEQSAGHAAE
jgi:hypothetical protein